MQNPFALSPDERIEADAFSVMLTLISKQVIDLEDPSKLVQMSFDIAESFSKEGKQRRMAREETKMNIVPFSKNEN